MTAFAYFKHDDVTLTLLGVGIVIVAARVAGRLFARIGQPPVIGEVVAGVLLGPTVLRGASQALFPIEARPLLKILSTLGLVMFMFEVGLGLETGHLGARR